MKRNTDYAGAKFKIENLNRLLMGPNPPYKIACETRLGKVDLYLTHKELLKFQATLNKFLTVLKAG